jgi:lipopolysaccharide export system permease protein
MVSSLSGRSIRWDSTSSKWTVDFYVIRDIHDKEETIRKGDKLDTALNINPEIFSRRDNFIETMNFDELNQFIAEQKLHGSPVNRLLIEKYRRMINPISTFILTLIGFALASRKVRGGIGLHIGLGITLSFVFILFMRFSSTFAVEGDLSPMAAVWMPNIVFALVALVLIRHAQK